MSLTFNASNFGIARKDWVTEHQSAPIAEVRNRMLALGFDQLPVIEDEKVVGFYKLNRSISKSIAEFVSLHYSQLLEFDTNFIGILSSFLNSKEDFFFVFKDNQIISLIHLSDLNALPARLYILTQVVNLEMNLALLIENRIPGNEILSWVAQKAQDKRSKYKSIHSNYNKLKVKHLELSILQFFYLINLYEIIKEKNIWDISGCDLRSINFNEINDLRNKVSHSVQPLVSHRNEVATIYATLLKIKEINFFLK